jgi:hypothetical protein
VNVGTHRSVLRSLIQACGALAGGCVAGERVIHRISTLALCVAGLLALSVGVAHAEPPKLVSYGNFADSPLPDGVAVDQSSSDVYVADFLNLETFSPGHVDKFDSSGELLSPPSPFGQAFDTGAAVDPTNGDVYVVNAFGEIDTYDPSSGTLLSSFPVPSFGGLVGAVVQLATDSAGNVYVPNEPSNEVLKYSPNGTLLQTFTGSGAGALSGPSGVAVDQSGDVWVADDGNNRIEELSPTGGLIGAMKSEGVQSVALDVHGDVFAMVHNSADFCGSLKPPCSHLVEYSSAGAQLADIGAGGIGVAEGTTLPSMLAVNDSSGRVYVTDGAKNLVWIFGPPTAPVLGRELAVEVSTSEAKLGALVNPGGIETSYRFEFGTTTAYGQTTPFPEGNVGQGVTSRTIWAAASGLAPGMTYHYRVIATNELGTVVGPDQAFTTETAAQASCPNEQLRGGFSASLPDCRAYELVTQPTKTSTQPDTTFLGGGAAPGNHAAREGNRMSYEATEIPPGSQSGGFNDVSTRGVGGWFSENVIPLQSYTADRCPLNDAKTQAFSNDLSKGVLFVGGSEYHNLTTELKGGCGAEGVEVVSGEPLGVENLLLRDNTNGAYQLINTPPAGVTPADAHFQGASSDLSTVVFDEHARLTANAPAGVDDLYEWSGGVVRLLTVLPDGTPVAGSLAASWDGHPRVISAEGSRVFFSADGNLYVRMNGAETVQVDARQGGSGPSGGGSFRDASSDGSRVFFTDENRLTGNSTSQVGKPDLYEYDVEAGPGQRLTDLTSGATESADVQRVSGVSEDGSYVYFVAGGVLTGLEENSQHATAQPGQPNLYLRHAGATTFIATLYAGDEGVRVSPDGAFLAVTSIKSLTGYDNTVQEIFLYSAASDRLSCASCNPSGEPPSAGGATMETRSAGAPHYLSDSGRLFFDTAEALLPRDTNGQIDVYEYENGQLYLISTGTSSNESVIADASESGNDVFFLTRQKLVPQDTNEEALNIYDARVDGGFRTVSSPPSCTTADACRTPVSPQPSLYGAPSSQTFSGAGNLTPPAEVKPKKKSKTKQKAKRKVCKRNKHKRGRCAARARNAGPKAKSYKGGK